MHWGEPVGHGTAALCRETNVGKKVSYLLLHGGRGSGLQSAKATGKNRGPDGTTDATDHQGSGSAGIARKAAREKTPQGYRTA